MKLTYPQLTKHLYIVLFFSFCLLAIKMCTFKVDHKMLANSIAAMYSYCVMSIVQMLIRCPITCMKCLLCLFLKFFIHDAMIRRFPWSYIHFGLNAHKNEICIYHILILITDLKEAALVICLIHSSVMRCMSSSVQCRKRKDILMEDNE